MNKVITINLGGNAYQLEEGGYDALRAYLETAAVRLIDNPDRDEILSDIESAIAEKFRALLGSHKTVVITKDVIAVLEEMGPIEGGEPSGSKSAGGPAGTDPAAKDRSQDASSAPRRLYRIYEGAMISGVCNGVAAYFNLDPTLIRLAFVFLTLFWGTGVLVYIVMIIVVPEARTPEERAAASGSPTTAQEFIRRAKEGYYEAIKNFPSNRERREWARKFRRDMRSWGRHWRYQWHWRSWSPGNAPQTSFCLSSTLPLFSILIGAITILWLCSAISLLATGSVLGMTLPANIPVWLAFVILFFLYGSLAGSLKAARRVCSWGMGPAQADWSIVFLLDATVRIAVAATIVVLAIHFFPQLREAVQAIPAQAHQAAHDISAWWKGQ